MEPLIAVSDTVLIVIGAIQAVVGVVGTMFATWISFRLKTMNIKVDENTIVTNESKIESSAARKQSESNSQKIDGVHHEMNSMKDALIVSAKLEGHAEGVEQERGRVEPVAHPMPALTSPGPITIESVNVESMKVESPKKLTAHDEENGHIG